MRYLILGKAWGMLSDETVQVTSEYFYGYLPYTRRSDSPEYSKSLKINHEWYRFSDIARISGLFFRFCQENVMTIFVKSTRPDFATIDVISGSNYKTI
jgi:hypothetical protein